MAERFAVPLADLPAHCLDAVDAAERARARTLVIKDGHPVAAIVPIPEYERIEPPDPGEGGGDPLLALCGTCRHDDFVDSLVVDFTRTALWHRG
jgi:hypothetical protein